MKVTIIIVVIVALGAAITFFLLRRKKQKSKIECKLSHSPFPQNIIEEKVDTIIYTDIVAYFKNLPLIKGQDTPFVATYKFYEDILKIMPITDKKTTLLIGTFNEKTNNLENVKTIMARSFDNRTKEILSKDSILAININKRYGYLQILRDMLKPIVVN